MAVVASQPALWQKAFDGLSAKHKTRLSLPASQVYASTHELLDDTLSLVRIQQKSCLDKRWKIRTSGKEIVVRDLWEKTVGWIQKFKEVGDIAVQYDTSAASLPWAVVRLVLQAAINDIEIFGAVAEGMELITRTIARCALYEAVYLEEAAGSDRKEFEQELVRLYTAILRYLSVVAAYYARGTAKRVLNSLANSTGHTKEEYEKVVQLEEDVERFARLLHGKATAQIAVLLQSMQTHQQTRYHALEGLLQSLEQPITEIAHTVSLLQIGIDDNERYEILNWLSPTNHLETHSKIHRTVTPGTGTWFLNSTEYQTWKNSASSATLWIRGIPGCGKTKLVSIAIQQLLDASVANPFLPPTAYYYCSRNVAGSAGSSALDVLRSILKQLACHPESDQIHSLVRDEFRKAKTTAVKAGVDMLAPRDDTCLELLASILEERPALILVDGVDEMESDPGTLLATIQDLVSKSSSTTQVLIASRDEPRISAHMSNLPSLSISSTHNAEDVALFVTTSLDQAIKEKRLLKGAVSADVRELMIKSLSRGASSMFLWASLQIQRFCDQSRYPKEKDIIVELNTLPLELSSVLQQIHERIQRYPSTEKQMVERLIGWLLVAERPLTASELMLPYGVDDTGFSANTQQTLDLCSDLVTRDIDSDQLEFVHSSVREYLETLPQYSRSHLNALVAAECITCLLDGSDLIDDSDSDSTITPSLHTYSVLFWARHYARVDTKDVSEPFDHLVSTFVLADGGQHFRYWIADVRAALKKGEASDPGLFAELSAIISAQPNAAVFLTSVYGLPGLLEKLAAQHANGDWSIRNDLGASPLYVSARYGHAEVVEKLIELGSCLQMTGGYLGSPIQAAAYSGHDVIVRKLIEAGADPWQKAKFENAIHAAIAGLQQSTIVALLTVCAADERAKPETWVSIAAYNGLRNVVSFLLDKIQQKMPGTEKTVASVEHDVLQSYLYRGFARAAWDELAKLPNVNAQGGHFGNALQAACMGGHYVLVKKLLKKGADPNTLGTYGSPLKAACLAGKIELVELLLDGGAAADQSDVLVAAASQGHLNMVKLLVQRSPERKSNKYDIDHETSAIEAALYAASRQGDRDIVEVLLKNGARQFASAALEHALENHHHDVARLLFDHITEIVNYTRFGLVMCGMPRREAWLDLDVEKELRGSRSVSRRSSASEAEHGFMDTVVGHERDIGPYTHRRRNQLGLDQPQGERYLQSLLAVRGSAEEFASALDRGLTFDPRGYPSPIEMAAKVGNLGVVELLLDRGGELRAALHTAVYCRQPEIIRLIFQKRPDTDPDIITGQELPESYRTIKHGSALSLAIDNGAVAIVELLLEFKERSPRPGPGPSLSQALRGPSKDVFDRVLISACKMRPSRWDDAEQAAIFATVQVAACNGDLNTLHKIFSTTGILLEEPQKSLEAICHETIVQQQPHIMEYLYELTSSSAREQLVGKVLLALVKGKSIPLAERPEAEVQPDDLYDRFVEPYIGTAAFNVGLEEACAYLLRDHDYAYTGQLLQRFTDPASTTSSSRVLNSVLQHLDPTWSGYHNNKTDAIAFVRLLLDQRLDVNQLDVKGKAPLYYACCKGWEEVVPLFIGAGADVGVLHVYEPKACRDQAQDSEPEDIDIKPIGVTKPALNLLELTLRNATFGVGNHDRVQEHRIWANIVFELLQAGLVCEADNPDLIRLFESACHHGVTGHVTRLLEPATWMHFSSIPNLIETSSGLQLAAYRAIRGSVRVLIDNGADSRPKPLAARDNQMVTPIQAVLEAGDFRALVEPHFEVLHLLLTLEPTEDDIEACVELFLREDQIALARTLLQRPTKVPNVPEDISPAALDLLLEEQHRPLVNFKALASSLASYMAARDRTYEQIVQRLDILHRLQIALPPAAKLFPAVFKTYWISGHERIALLDSLIQYYKHDINAPFPCKHCKHPINILLLAYQAYYLDGSEEFFKALLERGADPDCPGISLPLLVLACRSKRYLDDNETARRCSIATLLLQHGANIHGTRTLPSDAHTQPIEQTPLMFAVGALNIPLSEILLGQGADINRGAVAPLTLALRRRNKYRPTDDLDMIDMLIRRGAEARRHDEAVEEHLDIEVGFTGAFYRWGACLECEINERDYGASSCEALSDSGSL